MIRFTALLAVLGAALVGVASIGAAPSAPKTLSGSVGPSETIVLKKGSSRVSSIPRGRYTFVVSDRSSEHNFHLRGPVNKVLTSVSWTGTKRVTLNLKPGSYTYVCDPHSRDMIGSFRVR